MRVRRCRNRIAVPEAWGAGGGGRSLRCFVRMTSLPRCGDVGAGDRVYFFFKPRVCYGQHRKRVHTATHMHTTRSRAPRLREAPWERDSEVSGDSRVLPAFNSRPGGPPFGEKPPCCRPRPLPGAELGAHDARSLRVFSTACAPRQCKSHPLLFTNVCRLESSLPPR